MNSGQVEALLRIARRYPDPLVVINAWTYGSSLIRKGLVLKRPTNAPLTEETGDDRARAEYRLTAEGVKVISIYDFAEFARIDSLIREKAGS
jgi:hypothetical protein